MNLLFLKKYILCKWKCKINSSISSFIFLKLLVRASTGSFCLGKYLKIVINPLVYARVTIGYKLDQKVLLILGTEENLYDINRKALRCII